MTGLEDALRLARRAADGPEPGRAALLLATALEDLQPEFRRIRAAARRHLKTT